jgi:hypothetical protein
VKYLNFTGAGTDGNIFLIIYGSSGLQTSELKLVNFEETEKDLFEKSSIEKFRIKDIDVGQICKINVSHDGTDFTDDWHLESVTITMDSIKDQIFL